jgi:Spy/CpxP family protein refolding chaperone
MKRLALWMGAVGLVLAANLQAGEKPVKEGPGEQGPVKIKVKGGDGGGMVFVEGQGKAGQPDKGKGKGKSAAERYIASIDPIVNLTQFQKAEITDILQAREEALKDFQTRNGARLNEVGAALKEAHKSQDKDAIADIQAEYQELYAPLHRIMKKAEAALDDLLTGEQKAKLREARMMDMVKGIIGSIELTDQQLRQVKAACDALTRDEPDAGAFGKQHSAKLNQAIQEILTPQQKAALARERAMGYIKKMYGPAKLTEDQLQQAEALCDALLREQTGKSKEHYNQLADAVDRMLTVEQRENLEKARAGKAGGRSGKLPSAPPLPKTEEGKGKE